jgi:hypothetical protein
MHTLVHVHTFLFLTLNGSGRVHLPVHDILRFRELQAPISGSESERLNDGGIRSLPIARGEEVK